MITARRLKEVLGRRPFKPVRVSLSDGSRHQIPHPEFAWVFRGRLFIGLASGGGNELEGDVKELSILHITRIEETSPPKARK
jgi:hypothetical protein